MTFGGAPNPSRWSDLSKGACDLINLLMLDTKWDLLGLLQYIPIEIPTMKPLADDIPFATAEPLAFEIEDNDSGKCDNYINDAIGAVPDFGNNVCRIAITMPLVICLLG